MHCMCCISQNSRFPISSYQPYVMNKLRRIVIIKPRICNWFVSSHVIHLVTSTFASRSLLYFCLSARRRSTPVTQLWLPLLSKPRGLNKLVDLLHTTVATTFPKKSISLVYNAGSNIEINSCKSNKVVTKTKTWIRQVAEKLLLILYVTASLQE